MKRKIRTYEPATAQIIELTLVDVITTSDAIDPIERDEGINDGEWTPYSSKNIGG